MIGTRLSLSSPNPTQTTSSTAFHPCAAMSRYATDSFGCVLRSGSVDKIIGYFIVYAKQSTPIYLDLDEIWQGERLHYEKPDRKRKTLVTVVCRTVTRGNIAQRKPVEKMTVKASKEIV